MSGFRVSIHSIENTRLYMGQSVRLVITPLDSETLLHGEICLTQIVLRIENLEDNPSMLYYNHIPPSPGKLCDRSSPARPSTCPKFYTTSISGEKEFTPKRA